MEMIADQCAVHARNRGRLDTAPCPVIVEEQPTNERELPCPSLPILEATLALALTSCETSSKKSGLTKAENATLAKKFSSFTENAVGPLKVTAKLFDTGFLQNVVDNLVNSQLWTDKIINGARRVDAFARTGFLLGHAAAFAGTYSTMNLRTLASVSGHKRRPFRTSRTKCGSRIASRPNVTGDIPPFCWRKASICSINRGDKDSMSRRHK